MREVYEISECAAWNNSEILYYDGTRRSFLCFEEIELRLHFLLHFTTVCESILVQEIPTEYNIKKTYVLKLHIFSCDSSGWRPAATCRFL